jgi:hypothetical protein
LRDSIKSTDCPDWESFLAWIGNGDAFVFTELVKEHDLTVIVANNEFAIIEPGVACIVMRGKRITISFVDLNRKHF